MNNCEHKFVYLETHKSRTHYDRGYNNFQKTDVFFCEKCLEYKEKVTQGDALEVPAWFKN